ncbi:MAG: threonine synthase [Pseudomonadota bacterium]
MLYHSTRGGVPAASFDEVLLAGLAADGGLYLPTEWPKMDRSRALDIGALDYSEAAAAILAIFAGDAFSQASLGQMTQNAYAKFAGNIVAPLTQVDDEDWILELYHGPTLAFKDFAMQLLGPLFDTVLAKINKKVTIIAATSGDTGAAAIDALKGRAQVDVVVLHPEGRVTDVQRRMMTTIDDPNVYNIAVDGSFDDCQSIVKSLFANNEFSETVNLSGVNSINWARLAAQTVYYFTSCAALRTKGPINFVVPTGNFGDVYAGYAAKKMGANIAMLGVATNRNDILHRALTTGDYFPHEVKATGSPSMDIQVASNFERLLYDAMHGESSALARRMASFSAENGMTLSAAERTFMAQDFVSYSTCEDKTKVEIKQHHNDTRSLIDPHTAVARVAAKALRAKGNMEGPIVTLSTAHPAKFPDTVREATGISPELPSQHSDLFDRKERMIHAPNNVNAVADVIRCSVRAAA